MLLMRLLETGLFLTLYVNASIKGFFLVIVVLIVIIVVFQIS